MLTQTLDPISWPRLCPTGIYFIPVSDASPGGWGPPFRDEFGVLINPPMGTQDGYPHGVVINTNIVNPDNRITRGVSATADFYRVDWTGSAVASRLVWELSGHGSSNVRYWGHGVGSAIYKCGEAFTIPPNSIASEAVKGATAFEEGGVIYLAMITGKNYWDGTDFHGLRLRAIVRVWQDSYTGHEWYDETTNPLGWRDLGTYDISPTDEAVLDISPGEFREVYLGQGIYFSGDGKSGTSTLARRWYVSSSDNNVHSWGTLDVALTATSAIFSHTEQRRYTEQGSYTSSALYEEHYTEPSGWIKNYNGTSNFISAKEYGINGQIVAADYQGNTKVTASINYTRTVEHASSYSGWVTSTEDHYEDDLLDREIEVVEYVAPFGSIKLQDNIYTTTTVTSTGNNQDDTEQTDILYQRKRNTLLYMDLRYNKYALQKLEYSQTKSLTGTKPNGLPLQEVFTTSFVNQWDVAYVIDGTSYYAGTSTDSGGGTTSPGDGRPDGYLSASGSGAFRNETSSSLPDFSEPLSDGATLPEYFFNPRAEGWDEIDSLSDYMTEQGGAGVFHAAVTDQNSIMCAVLNKATWSGGITFALAGDQEGYLTGQGDLQTYIGMPGASAAFYDLGYK